ncbi:invasion associated locus B family protein [Methylobacterium nodulans]|uniref:Invasion associated locus B family protein n=1 Tax=Methylobacterium nodulans (strain LMG 21967 / CNCM I-2342 / ORS 2060) TaxID=460265 RepID=B8IQY9_METNO|nr:invasion associated locus B family protein [Methylobacterium nodulans]ACL56691.1 Invasion associated locus B family protein [Methylobacterium nodulans ORS 2060]
MPSRRSTRLALTLALALAGAPVLGQEGEAPEPAPAPAPAKPARRPAPAPRKPAPASAPAAAPSGWPPGASAVSEVYGDWTINCTRESAARRCALSQAQGEAQTGRRRFSIELRPPENGRSEGVILMPLGLALEPGVTFKLDDATLGKGAPFSTCVAAGCVVPISFPTIATDAMKTAVALRITGTKPNGEAETITVPLAGFAAALARVALLAG